jgi:hypothetical protein
VNIYPGKIPTWADTEQPLFTRARDLARLVGERLGLASDDNLAAAANGDLVRTRLATAGGQPPIVSDRADPRFYELTEYLWAIPAGGTPPALVRCGIDWAVELANWAWEREIIERGPSMATPGQRMARMAEAAEAQRALLERSSDRVKAWAVVDAMAREGQAPYNLATVRKARGALVRDWVKAARLNRLDGTPHTPREVWERRARRAQSAVDRIESRIWQEQRKLDKAKQVVDRWRAKGFL